MQPSDWHEVFAAFGVVNPFTMIAAAPSDFEHRHFSFRCDYTKISGGLRTARHAAHADEAVAGYLNPHAVVGV